MKEKLMIFFICSFILFAEVKQDVKLIIYNQNFAVCDEVREKEIPAGKLELIFSDIPKFIEPTSIQIYSLNYPDDFIVLEQGFNSNEYNLLKILSKNIGEKVEIIDKGGNVYTGILLFYDSRDIGIEMKDKIIVLRELKEISFNKIEEFIYKPQLKFVVQNNKTGLHKILLKYTTSNINWKADYIGEYDEERNKLNLKGFITVDNKSGVDFKDVSLILVAGEVKKITEMRVDKGWGERTKAISLAAEAMPTFEESPVFEFHKYTLKGKTDIKNEEIKQINFISAKNIVVDKKYVYDGATYRYYYYDNWHSLPYNEKVQIFVEFKNEKEVLPSGKIRVFKNEKEGTIFIGENIIPHTPVGEKVKLSLGNVFDVKGERKVINHERISEKVYKDTYEIKIKNFKNNDIIIEVIEHLYGTWEITEKTHKFEKIDAYTIKFPVKVKANSEEVVKYTATFKF